MVARHVTSCPLALAAGPAGSRKGSPHRKTYFSPSQPPKGPDNPKSQLESQLDNLNTPTDFSLR